ncbi:MAG: type II toxin-antitoxin system Phd/YefM family antitoxin [Rubrobacter sp.]|nr:type II toxin-antitoxin system Phd/YefM family antitoxin [Rubrobacter sp.]
MDVTRIGASEARGSFPEIVNRVAYGGERVVVERRGKKLAAVVSMEDLRLLESLAAKEEDRIDTEESRKNLADEERVPWREIKEGRGL